MASPRERRLLPPIFWMENPFGVKVLHVFTGAGVGCGVGISIGRPIYLGMIPGLQQVMSATRGATDSFSGVTRHVNSALRKAGLKNIEAGIGCGVSIGHGFGIGYLLVHIMVAFLEITSACFGQSDSGLGLQGIGDRGHLYTIGMKV